LYYILFSHLGYYFAHMALLQSTCVVCLDAVATHAFVCDAFIHQCVCESCGTQLAGKCPVCQFQSNKCIKVFVINQGEITNHTAPVVDTVIPPTPQNIISHSEDFFDGRSAREMLESYLKEWYPNLQIAE
jgi:hypothetical protein